MKRREFLRTVASATAALGVPAVVPNSVLGRTAPSDRVNVGFVGLGNQSTIDLPAFLNQADVQVVAVCDVNKGSGGYNNPKHFLGREPGLARVHDHYAAQTKSGTYSGCRAYTDFQELLARDDIDAVVVVVPDHWHAIMTIMAAKAGKDIYCEKPLSLSIDQGKAMVKAVRENHRILQTGSHHRSGQAARVACELVRNGRIGKVNRIYADVAVNNAVDPGPGWKPMPVPDGFDYERWLGPAPWAPYHKDRCLYRFRFNSDYSGGQTTNYGAHSLDIAQWGNGTELTGPVEFEDFGSEWPRPGGLYNTATKVAFRARYADGVELICQTTPESLRTRFEGTEGWVQYDYHGVSTYPESLKSSEIQLSEIHLPRSNPNRTDNVYRNYLPDHVYNFIEAVKARRDPIEPVEVGHRTATLCHLGNIAMRLKRRIQWDPEAERVVGDDEASAMTVRSMRAPWHL